MKIREEIYKILNKINNDKGYSTEIVKNLNMNKYNIMDRNLLREMVYGIVENRLLIDHVISKFSHTPSHKLDREVIEILRMGVYQILFMDKIPEYAVISESLFLIEKNSDKRLKGFVDGVLRAVVQNKENALSISGMKIEDELSIKYSINKELLELLIEQYSLKTVKKILKSFLIKDSLTIRVNNLKTNVAELSASLHHHGYNVSHHHAVKDALVISNPQGIVDTSEFLNGHFIIQDAGSILVSQILNPCENAMVLDTCSAPGGKTTHLSEIMNNTGKIVANDIHVEKLDKIHENAIRLGCQNIVCYQQDNTIFKSDYTDKYDFILVDAPCSGLGIVSRKPEIKLNRKKSEISKLVDTQKLILDNAFKYLKSGGSLVYSTCTILKQENEEIIEWVEANYGNIARVDIDYHGGKRDYIKIMPYEKDFGGFFMVKFIKS